MTRDAAWRTVSAVARGALAFYVATTASAPAADQTIDSVYTDYDTKTCAHRAGRDVEDYGEWRCRGLNGLVVLLHAGDQRMTISFGPRAKNEPAAGQTLRGFNDIYRTRIEWRGVRGRGRARPFAAIVGWNTFLLEEHDTPDRAVKGKVLVVIRLGPDGICHVGYVDALANADPSQLARKIADERARSFRCGTDKPVIVGETGKGFSSSGEAVKVP